MPTRPAMDDDLLREAVRVGGRRTKRETVNEALGFRPDWDSKKAGQRS